MKTILASFIVLTVAFAFVAIGIMAFAIPTWVGANLDLATGLSFVAGVFVSAFVVVIEEPVKTGSKTLLASNI